MNNETVTKRVLCLNIPHTSRLSQYEKKKSIYFPIGLAYIIRSITSNYPEIKIKLLDVNFHPFDRHSFQGFISANYRDGSFPDFVMYGAMSNNYKQLKKITETIKSLYPNLKIICGGTIATIHSQYLLEQLGIDICVIGEGEDTIIDLLREPDKLHSIKGIAFLDNNKKYIRIPDRERVKKIQSLTPVYKFFDIESYISAAKTVSGYRSIIISGSRGCSYKCKFCFRPFGNKIIYRTPEEVAKEVEWLVNNYKLEAFELCDELAWADKSWMESFGECLIKNNIKVMWKTGGRINLFSYKDCDLLKLMKKAGLVRICFGLESANQELLIKMGKTGVSKEKAYKVFKMVRNIGIKPSVSILMGYPGETPETICETVKFLRKNLLTMKGFFILQPFPGTEVYESFVKNYIDEEEWLEKYSHEGAATKLTVNLTDMSDDEFMYCILKAQKKIISKSLYHYIKYYSLTELPKQISIDIYRFIRMKVTGASYETP